jgi:PAS domain S-box-containing protein
MFSFTPYLLPFIISALALLLLAFPVWSLRRNLLAVFMLVMLVCVELWTVGFILEIAAQDLELKVLLSNLQFLGIDFIPVVWLAITFCFTGQLSRRINLIRVLAVIAILDQFVIWTNPLHHLFRHNPSIDYTSAPFPVLVNNYSYSFYIMQLLAYLICFANIVMLLQNLEHTSGNYRKQILCMVASTVLPLLFGALYLVGASPIPHLNLSSITFSISGLILIWGLTHYGFLDLIPIARSTLVDNLTDAWIVLDQSGRLVDLNQAAELIFRRPSHEVTGQSVRDALGESVLSLCLEGDILRQEICLEENNLKRYYDLSLNPLRNERGRMRGRLAVLRDITARVEVEQEREKLIHQLQEALAQVKTLEGLLPICASCKNIRDDQGYWHNVENYLEKHSEVSFSHGICPACLYKLYPDVADEVLNEIAS